MAHRSSTSSPDRSRLGDSDLSVGKMGEDEEGCQDGELLNNLAELEEDENEKKEPDVRRERDGGIEISDTEESVAPKELNQVQRSLCPSVNLEVSGSDLLEPFARPTLAPSRYAHFACGPGHSGSSLNQRACKVDSVSDGSSVSNSYSVCFGSNNSTINTVTPSFSSFNNVTAATSPVTSPKRHICMMPISSTRDCRFPSVSFTQVPSRSYQAANASNSTSFCKSVHPNSGVRVLLSTRLKERALKRSSPATLATASAKRAQTSSDALLDRSRQHIRYNPVIIRDPKNDPFSMAAEVSDQEMETASVSIKGKVQFNDMNDNGSDPNDRDFKDVVVEEEEVNKKNEGNRENTLFDAALPDCIGHRFDSLDSKEAVECMLGSVENDLLSPPACASTRSFIVSGQPDVWPLNSSHCSSLVTTPAIHSVGRGGSFFMSSKIRRMTNRISVASENPNLSALISDNLDSCPATCSSSSNSTTTASTASMMNTEIGASESEASFVCGNLARSTRGALAGSGFTKWSTSIQHPVHKSFRSSTRRSISAERHSTICSSDSVPDSAVSHLPIAALPKSHGQSLIGKILS
ncbi:unnamed protein product [Protopolystoma xenopodis]|uniref:Uncharacterized protein n=1 Tax=Protopolystoma xenopodis TaxID=117903 RepID=A0A3S5A602_9PLAT|nr:unnamed protein product [Protopolystoma xenopodis]